MKAAPLMVGDKNMIKKVWKHAMRWSYLLDRKSGSIRVVYAPYISADPIYPEDLKMKY